MSEIVRDIVETKQTNKVTGPYLDKSSLGSAIAGSFITLADTAGKWMTSKAEDMSKALRGSGSGSSKNYTPLMNEAERIRSWIQQESPSIEAQQAEIARFNSNAAALGFNPSDIKNIMEVSNLSPAKTATEEEMTRLAKQQQAEETMFRDVAVAEGISPDDPDVIEYGKATVINSQAAQTIIDSIPTYKDVATRERILRDNESILSRGLLSSFNTYKTNIPEVNTESIAAFKSQYVTELTSKGVPFSYARYLTDTYLGPYENTVKLFAGDKEKINAEIELQNKLRSNAEVQWFYNTVYPYKTKEGNTVAMSGAKIATIEKLAPSTVKSFLDMGLLASLPSALASNIESVPTEDQRKLVQPGTYGFVFNSIPSEEGKQKLNENVRNPLLDKMNKAAESASAEDVVKAKVETAPMRSFNSMSNGISAEDAKKDPTWNSTVEGVMQSQAGLLNKLFNGYGTALVDPNTGAIRYFGADFNNDGTFDNFEDATNEGLLVPWGDQDAVQFRDSVAAELRQFMSNATKGGMSRKEAADKWNMNAVMNTTNFKRYADALRSGQGSKAVGLDTPMSSEEAIMISKILLGTPKAGEWKRTTKDIGGIVTRGVGDVVEGVVGAAELAGNAPGMLATAPAEIIGTVAGDLIDQSGARREESLRRVQQMHVDALTQEQRESGRVPPPQPNRPFEDGSYTNKEVAEVAPEGVFRETDKDNNMLVSVPAESKIQSPIEGSVVANATDRGFTTIVIRDPNNEELMWTIRGRALKIPVTQGTKVKAGEVLGKATGDTDVSIGLYMADSSNFFGGNTVKLNATALQRRGKVPPVQPNRK